MTLRLIFQNPVTFAKLMVSVYYAGIISMNHKTAYGSDDYSSQEISQKKCVCV